MTRCLLGAALLFVAPWTAAATEAADISLPPPRTAGGMPLLNALADRQSARAFSPRQLPEQLLADLLWAAFGINRPDSGRRTAPSARNWQEIEIYVVMADAAYLYDPQANRLRLVVPGDLRALTGRQEFVAGAALNLVYVADLDKMGQATEADKALYAAADTGFIGQNVYLFCASEGLATVIRGLVDRDTLAAALRLPEHKRIILAQSVGFPP